MNLAALIFIIKFIFFSTTVRAAPRRSASSRSHDESASRNGTLDTQSTEKVRQAAVCRSEGETCGAYGKSDDCCPHLKLDCLHGCNANYADGNYFVLSKKQSWSQAKAACEAKGAKLAQLSTPTAVENAAKKIQEKTHYWIGGHCPDCRRPDVRDDKWKWIDGEKIPLDHPYWKLWTEVYSGITAKTPHDVDGRGDAKFLTLYRKDGNAQFVNSCCGQRPALCHDCRPICVRSRRFKPWRQSCHSETGTQNLGTRRESITGTANIEHNKTINFTIF